MMTSTHIPLALISLAKRSIGGCGLAVVDSGGGGGGGAEAANTDIEDTSAINWQ